VDFMATADSVFELNVSKTQVRIPQALRAELGTIASSVARAAQEVYRGFSDGSRASDSSTARFDAVRELVGMVLSAVRSTLMEELDPHSPQGISIFKRISDLEQELAMEVTMLVTAQAPQNGHLTSSKDRTTVRD